MEAEECFVFAQVVFLNKKRKTLPQKGYRPDIVVDGNSTSYWGITFEELNLLNFDVPTIAKIKFTFTSVHLKEITAGQTFEIMEGGNCVGTGIFLGNKKEKLYAIENITTLTKKPFLYVDFNEFIESDTIMLSQSDVKKDFYGNSVTLSEGLDIVGYQQDEDNDGSRDDIIVQGICMRNKTQVAVHVKWLLQINQKGVRLVSDVLHQGW